MNLTFADTYFYLALLNRRDAGHQAAKVASVALEGGIVTTHWVLVEVADAFSSPADRPKFLKLLDMLLSDPDVQIIPADKAIFQRGVELYRRRADKDWPLTDCLSFVTMNDLQINEALTADVHFRQAEFVPLLAE